MKRSLSQAAALLLLLAGTGAAARPSPLAPSGLKAQWNFAEGSGTTAADSSGNTFAGTLTNGPAWTMGRVGTGLSFDGTNDFVKLPDNSAILNSVPAASLSLWIKPTATTASGSFRELVSLSIGSSAATNTSRIALSLQGNGAGGQIFAGGRSTDAEAQKNTMTAAGVTVGTWTHVAAVFDFTGNSITVYINGQVAASATALAFASATTPNTACRSCALGAQDMGDSNFFAGAMDEVQIYGRALLASEVATQAQGDALAGRWSFDEGAGTSVGDSSGNATNGTTRNGPFWTGGQMGNALSFNGTSQSVDLGSNLNILRNVNAATLSAWVKPTSVIPNGSFREIVSISVNAASPTNASRVALALKGDGTSGGDLYAGGRSTDTEPQKAAIFDTNLAVNAWVHVAAVIDFAGKSISLYVNGEPAGSSLVADFAQTHTPNTASTNAAFAAQDQGDSNCFAGLIDDVRVYARPLSRCDVELLALHDGLHAWWKFDEGSGTTAADSSDHAVNGTLVNGVTFAAGQFGTAANFGTSNGYITLGSNLDILSGVRAATVATWVKIGTLPASGAFRELVSISVNNGSTPTNTSRLAFSLVGDGTAADVFAGGRSTDSETQQSVTADANLAAGTWYHVAAVIDYGANTIRVYKNGTQIAVQTVAFSQPVTPNSLSTNAALGAQDTGDSNWLSGLLDDARVYCRTLSAAEIAALATPTRPSAPTNLVGTPGDTKATLTWTPGTGSTSTNIYMRLDTGTYPSTPLANVTGATFDATGLTNGTKYWFKAAGVNAAGEGPATAEVEVTPPGATTAPSAPILLTPTKKTNDPQPTIVGTAGPGLTIKLYFNGVQEATTTISDFQGNWSIKPTAKADGIYTVTAKASNGTDSPASSAITITVDRQVNPPTNLLVSAQNTQTQLSWSASPDSDVIGYEVWRSDGGAAFHKIHIGVVVGTSYTDTGLTNGTLYCYQIRAVDNTLQEAP